MNIGFFTNAQKDSILVVYDYEFWTSTIQTRGFSTSPLLVRKATSPEIGLAESNPGFQGWKYNCMEALLDDEINSGAQIPHLKGLTALRLIQGVLNREGRIA